eukprot:GEMP01072198.1.p3 GENE.GEMP01072198.1~~GEMP01072198.1.p3  ORF type:complete len:102 (+),score=18.39 GEMP01072198.1:337-642(+)
MWNYKMVVNRSEQWVVSDCSHKVYIGTGTMLWSASGALAEFLADNGVFVVATDLDEQCPLLKLNCEANNAPIEVVALPWGCKKAYRTLSDMDRLICFSARI